MTGVAAEALDTNAVDMVTGVSLYPVTGTRHSGQLGGPDVDTAPALINMAHVPQKLLWPHGSKE